MRVLVVHHGTVADGVPVTGGALRAWVHVEALRGAGHEVRRLSRAQDEPDGFRSQGDLRRLAAAFEPDWILCVAPEEAPALARVAPLVVDLYAPRLLEAAFEGLQPEEAGRALRAVHAADEVLFSNARQRWFWMGILGVCGWDLSQPTGMIVPLAAVPPPGARRRPKRPVFVAGGRAWPWQDQRATLAEAARLLGDRGEVHSYGLPAVEGVRAHPLTSRTAWLEACLGATAALDRFVPNPERALAMSFRQADYLACGLPLICDADTPLADEVRELKAGWVTEPLAVAIESALSEQRDSSALALRYAPDVTEAPLLGWTPRRRQRHWTLLSRGARLAAAETRAAADREARAAAEAEVEAKRAEIEGLNAQVRALAGSVEALSSAVADAVAFRKETVQVLGARLGGEGARAEHLARELEIVRADLMKKSAELEALTAERDRLGAWLKKLGDGVKR